MNYLERLLRTKVRRESPPPPPPLDLSPPLQLLTEGELVEGRSYTAIWGINPRGNDGGKEFLGRFQRGEGTKRFEILNNNKQFVLKISPYISFERPEGGWDATREFPVGHFDRFGVFFEEGNTAPRRGGKRRRGRRSTRSRRNGRQSTRKIT